MTHIDAHKLVVGEKVKDVVDSIELRAFCGNVPAPEIDAITIQPQVMVKREAGGEQVLYVTDIVGNQVEAVRPVGQQGHVVGNGPGAAALVCH